MTIDGTLKGNKPSENASNKLTEKMAYYHKSRCYVPLQMLVSLISALCKIKGPQAIPLLTFFQDKISRKILKRFVALKQPKVFAILQRRRICYNPILSSVFHKYF